MSHWSNLKNKSKPRIPALNAKKKFKDLQEIHFIPTNEHWYWGTPRFDRAEDVQIVAGNIKQLRTLIIKLRWRPVTGENLISKNLVSLETRVSLIINERHFYYHNVETYLPEESTVRPGYITQYGSKAANLKVFVLSPYRRERITFRGHMVDMSSEGKDESFIRFSLITNSTSSINDFKYQIHEDFFEDSKKLVANINASDNKEALELVSDDRIDRLYRYVGEFHQGDGPKKDIYLWGFKTTSYFSSPSDKVSRKRILCHLSNGIAFHIFYSTKDSLKSPGLQSGYTCFYPNNWTDPVRTCVQSVDWFNLSEESNEFRVEIYNQGILVKIDAKRRSEQLPIFDAVFNETTGWAFVIEESDDSRADSDQLKSSYEILRSKIQSGLRVPFPNTKTLTKQLVLDVGVDEGSFDIDIVGAKACSLAQLTSLSKVKELFHVPRAFALTRFAHDLIIEENDKLRNAIIEFDEFLELLSETTITNSDAIKERCNQMIDLYKEIKLPEKLTEQLAVKLNETFPEVITTHPFAIRSSSWGEDGEEMSAAGQLSTFLNVRGLQSIHEAIINCFASKYSAENVIYKIQHGLSPNLPMAIIVQSMIDCDCAGVMFTCHPVSGDDRIIMINANYGLGESVVSGEADPDQILLYIDNVGNILRAPVEIGKKTKIISERLEISDDRRSSLCMDEAFQVFSDIACLVSEFFGGPTDIEWGMHENNFFLFQARPITGLEPLTNIELLHEADHPSRLEDDWKTRVNLNEVFPYAVTPMTMTYYLYSWSISACQLEQEYQDRLQSSIDNTNSVIFDSYHCFFSLIGSHILPTAGYEKSKPDPMLKQFEMSFFGHEVGPQPAIYKASYQLAKIPSQFKGTKYNLKNINMRLAPVSSVSRLYKQVNQYDKLVSNIKTDDLTILYNHLNKLNELHSQNVCQLWIMIFFSGLANMKLSMLLSKYINNPQQVYATMNKFLGHSNNVVSAKIPKEISNLCQLIRDKGVDECKKFSTLTLSEADEYLSNSPDEKLKKTFNKFIKKFGHRCYNEWEFRTDPWRCDKKPVISMIQRACEAERKPTKPIKHLSVDKIINNLDINFSWKEKLWLTQILVPQAQRMVSAREITKDISIKCIDIKRKVFRLMGQLLNRKLRIPDPDLLYFFMFDELEPLIRDSQPLLVRRASQRRQMYERNFKVEWRFDEIIGGYQLIPKHLKDDIGLDSSLPLKSDKLFGSPGSSGKARGIARIIMGYEELDKIRSGDILVTYSTDIAFSTVFPLLTGIITEVGGLVSHGAVVAREYGLPSLLSVTNATKILKDGEEIILDADIGQIIRCEFV